MDRGRKGCQVSIENGTEVRGEFSIECLCLFEEHLGGNGFKQRKIKACGTDRFDLRAINQRAKYEESLIVARVRLGQGQIVGLEEMVCDAKLRETEIW
jgi:hypothetical protein